MPWFVIANPKDRTVTPVKCDGVVEAQQLAGLGAVDHGVLYRGSDGNGVGYCIYEYAFFTPTSEQHYFSIAGVLMAGPVVFYAFDEAGETIDVRRSALPDIRWYLGVNDVEAAIHHEEIVRPIMSVNGVLLWEWPNQPPTGYGQH